VSGLREYGGTLLDHGYNIIPIKEGGKRPGLSKWQKIQANEQLLGRWLSNGYANGGVGILTSNTPAVDLDVLDEDLVEMLVKWCEKHIGATVQRVGYAPKKLLVYRTDTPFKKIQSRSYDDFMGEQNKVEVLGDGQQFVAYSIHPNTKKPYEWVTEDDLAMTSWEDLPVMTRDHAIALVDYFESEIVPLREDWKPKKGSHLSVGSMAEKSSDEDLLGRFKERVEISTEELKRHLKIISSDDYDRWVQIGMALYHQYGGSEEGFNLWDLWSQHMGGEYPGEREMRFRWRGFSADINHTTPITARSIIKWSRDERRNRDEVVVEGGEKVVVKMDLDGFIDRFYFVGDGPHVVDRVSPRQHAVRTMREFVAWTAPYKTEIPDPTTREPKRTKNVATSGLWLQNRERKDLRGFDYEPGGETILTDYHGIEWFNTYQAPRWVVPEEVVADEDVDVLLEHLQFLFPVEEEMEWFINWMAYNVQHPGERCKIVPLLIARQHGMGRGWIVELMGDLLGHNNCSTTKLKDMSDERGSGFQGYLHKTVFCAIHEVREGNNKAFAISDHVRDLLVEDYLKINVKYGSDAHMRIYTSFLMMSNHLDALVLTREDRRIWVSTNGQSHRDPDYYQRIYRWKRETKTVQKIFGWLMQRDLSGFDAKGRAPMTPAKRAMIGATQSLTKNALFRLIADPPAELMPLEEIIVRVREFVAEESQEEALGINKKEVLAILKDHCRQLQRRDGALLRLEWRDGNQKHRVRPWCLKNPDSWSRSTVTECKEELWKVFPKKQTGDQEW